MSPNSTGDSTEQSPNLNLNPSLPPQSGKLKKIQQDIDEIRAKRKALQATPIEKDEPVERPMSVGGFAENVFQDASDLLKGLFINLPAAAIQGTKKVIEDPSKLSEIQFTPSGFVNGLVDSVIEPYQKHGFKVLYYRPVTTLLDALTVWDLGAASAGRALAMTGSKEGVRVAEMIRALPGQLVKEGTTGIARKLGIDLPARQEFKYLTREGRSYNLVRTAEDLESVVKPIEALSEEDKAIWHRFRTQGGTSAELAEHPEVAKALDSAREWVTEEVQPGLKARGLLSDQEASDAVVKKFAAEAYGDISKESLAKARQAIADPARDVKPFYGPAVFEKEGASFEDFLRDPEVQKLGKVGFLEEFTGAKGAIKDPAVYMRNAVTAYRNVEEKLRLIERVAQNPEWVKAVRSGEATLKDMIPSKGVFAKYFEDQASRAKGVASAEIAREKGFNLKTEAGAKEATEFIANDPSAQKRLAEARNIVITNPTVRRMLTSEFTTTTNGLLKLYDAIMGVFRKSATRWNPKWVPGNIFGDAFLGTLGGAKWREARQLILNELGPIESRAKYGMAGEGGLGGRLLDRYADIAGAADEWTRTGLIAKAVGDRIKRTGSAFEGSAQTLESVLKSTESFSDAQVKLQILQEQLGSRSPQIAKISKVYDKLEARTTALKEELNDLLKSKGKGVSDTLGRAKRADEVRKELAVTAQRMANLAESKGQILQEMTDNLMKQGALEATLPELRQQVSILRPSVDYANAFVGEYLGMSSFEQRWARRIFPFYAWTKAMTMLAFRLPFISPIRTFMWHRFGAAMMSMYGDDELPERVRGYIPMFGLKDGSQVWVKWSSFSPFSATRVEHTGDIAHPSGWDIGANPMIRLIFTLKGGKTIFDTSHVPYGEQMVNLHSGDVYQYTGRGTVQKIIPQTPLVSAITHMFPVTQFAEDVITPLMGFQTREHDWMGLPRPSMNPDGSYKYPVEWWRSLTNLVGANITTGKRDEYIRQEKMKIRQAVEALRNARKRASPEEQKFIDQSLRDYVQGEFRRLED